MAFHPVAIVHTVIDLESAVSFLRDVLRLPEQGRGDGWVVLDNGVLCVRLEAAEVPGGYVRLDLATRDLDDSAQKLLEHPQVRVLQTAHWVSPHRQEYRLQAPHGFELVLFREFSEDELGITPPLPTRLLWRPEAEQLMKALLRRVPLVFRAQVRAEATRMAEHTAVEQRRTEIDRADVAEGLMRASPEALQESMRRALIEAGVEVPARGQGR